ncbi:MAG: hypothetical protein FWE40_04175 [Oscillospiraceae bacterium]|nr:hypothetical protein [Oscillospiraceae bacterium]
MLLSMILISVVGLLLSWEYKGERYRMVIMLCRIVSIAVAAAAAVGMIVGYPPGDDDIDGVMIALGVVAIAANLPLATIGLKRNKKE